MKWLLLLSFSIFSLALSGCYLNSSISSLESNVVLPVAPISKLTTPSLEGVSGSSKYEITPVLGYKVKQAAGMLLNKQLATTPNGYKVYLHVNGRITSEELNQ